MTPSSPSRGTRRLCASALVLLLTLMTMTSAQANLLWERYADWSYFKKTGWWVNCQIMTSGEAGFSLALQAQVDGSGAPARRDLLLIHSGIDLTKGKSDSLDLSFERDDGESFEATLTVRRPSQAGREIAWNWPGTEILAGGGKLAIKTASGNALDRFSLEGFTAAHQQFTRCLSGEAEADKYLK